MKILYIREEVHKNYFIKLIVKISTVTDYKY